MRITLSLIIFAAFLTFAAGVGFGEASENHTLEVGAEISHITYKEPSIMQEKGIMHGLFASYTYSPNYMLRIEGKYSEGEMDYSSASSGTMKDIDDYMLEFRGLGGYVLPVEETFNLTPYIGIGYRYLNDDMHGRYSSTGAFGYEREISYIYSPIGLEIDTDLKNGWFFGASLEFDYFWDGTVKSNMGYVSGYYDIENSQDKGYGCRGSVKFQGIGERFDFLIEPFVRYWNIKRSNYTTDPGGTTWYEPKNTSVELGSKIAVVF